MKNLTIALAFLVTFSLGGCAPNINKGLAAFEAGDTATAFEVWETLAEKGDALAQHNLGYMYANGKGVTQDNAEAVKWYRLAAEQGLGQSQGFLSYAYHEGKGVTQDNAEAVKWARLAAEQGLAPAQGILGEAYDNGEGVPQDKVLAHMWYNIGASKGHKESGTKRKKLAKKMTSADISKAELMARECMSSNYKNCGE